MATRSKLDRLPTCGGRVVLSNLIPVDHIVECGNVLGATVLVLKVVCVLPHVDAEDGDEPRLSRAVHQRIVLVGRRDDLHGTVLCNREPRPARAKDAGRRRGEGGLERLVRIKRSVDLLTEGSLGDLTRGDRTPLGDPSRLRAHRAPEEGVVVVATGGIVELGRFGA